MQREEAPDWADRYKDWEHAHEAAVQAWLDEQGYEDLGSRQEAQFAAHCLVRVPAARDEGFLPGEPCREPYSWAEIDAYEVLFQQYVMAGGAMEGWEDQRILDAMRSFAAYLTRRGTIPSELGAELDRGFELWIPRALDALAGGPWWHRDAPQR